MFIEIDDSNGILFTRLCFAGSCMCYYFESCSNKVWFSSFDVYFIRTFINKG